MLRRNKGQATVEFALAVIVFFMFLLTIIDLGVMLFVHQTMQNAVRGGARLAVTGKNAGTDRLTPMIDEIKKQAFGFYEKNSPVRAPVVSRQSLTAAFGNYSGTPITGNPGNASEIITVRLDYSWPLLTPFLKRFFTGGKYSFTAKATVLNEPF